MTTRRLQNARDGLAGSDSAALATEVNVLIGRVESVDWTGLTEELESPNVAGCEPRVTSEPRESHMPKSDAVSPARRRLTRQDKFWNSIK